MPEGRMPWVLLVPLVGAALILIVIVGALVLALVR